MKVLLITKTNSGGGAAVAANRLNRALRRNGVDAKLLVQDLKRAEEGVFAVDYGLWYRFKSFARFALEKLLFLRFEKDRLARFAFSTADTGIDISQHPLVQEADILHLHWINQGFLSLDDIDKLMQLGKPIVWTQHDMWAFTGGCHYVGTCHEFLESCAYCPFLKKPAKNDLSSQLFAIKRRIYASTSISVVACSKWLRTMAQESKLFRSETFYNIPNSIDTAYYHKIDKTEARRRLGLPNDKKYILFGAANVDDSRKGIRYFVEAMAILDENYPSLKESIELVFFGKMSAKTKTLFPFKIHGYSFVKDPDTLINLYNAADIYVLPSLQDNLPNTVMEAMACGTPVVGFSIGGVPEMITDRLTGFLAEVKNSMSLATQIYDALFISNLNEIGRNAREKAIAQYSEKAVAASYQKVYQSALKK